jgi:hypothetical protein
MDRGKGFDRNVLNPTPATFDRLKPLLQEAYGLAVAKFCKRVAASP